MIKYKLSTLIKTILFASHLLIAISCCSTKATVIKYEPKVVNTKNELITEYMKAVEVLRYNNLLDYSKDRKEKKRE